MCFFVIVRDKFTVFICIAKKKRFIFLDFLKNRGGKGCGMPEILKK